MASVPLTLNITADGTYELGDWVGGEGHLGAEGDFGGGTLSIKSQKPGGSVKRSWGDNGDMTADKAITFKLPRNHTLFAVLAGATDPDINIDVSVTTPRRM